MLISHRGVPGSGKTTIAQELARRIRGVHLEVDAIERALPPRPGGSSSYRVAYSIAQARAGESLRSGRLVIADCVNPNSQVRDEWLEVARLAGVPALEVEVVCSDAGKHQRRLSGNANDAGILSRSQEVTRSYQPWGRQHLVVDTALQTVEDSVGAICKEIRFGHA